METTSISSIKTIIVVAATRAMCAGKASRKPHRDLASVDTGVPMLSVDGRVACAQCDDVVELGKRDVADRIRDERYSVSEG